MYLIAWIRKRARGPADLILGNQVYGVEQRFRRVLPETQVTGVSTLSCAAGKMVSQERQVGHCQINWLVT